MWGSKKIMKLYSPTMKICPYGFILWNIVKWNSFMTQDG
jgi:hypothetical protein